MHSYLSWPGLTRPSRLGMQCLSKRDHRDKPGDDKLRSNSARFSPIQISNSQAPSPVFFAAPGPPSCQLGSPRGSGAPGNAGCLRGTPGGRRSRPTRLARRVASVDGGAPPGAPLRRFLAPGLCFRARKDRCSPALIRAPFAALHPRRVQPFKAVPLLGTVGDPRPPGAAVTSRDSRRCSRLRLQSVSGRRPSREPE